MAKKNKILLFLLTIFCSIITAPFIGGLYSRYVTPISNWFIGPSHPEYFTGFILSFVFFGALFSYLLAERKIKYFLYYTLPFPLFMLLLGAFEELIIGVIMALIGWLLARGILLFKKKAS